MLTKIQTWVCLSACITVALSSSSIGMANSEEPSEGLPSALADMICSVYVILPLLLRSVTAVAGRMTCMVRIK